ncbi:unnamed protein product [Rotaria socialis]|uniref:DUF7044 domain-containing protein n=1 Tax=Rotaria socialis TaxID=392032 RepID=A0A820RVI9_9BILA|nr:unnamed protein product [Rotaria socialis]
MESSSSLNKQLIAAGTDTIQLLEIESNQSMQLDCCATELAKTIINEGDENIIEPENQFKINLMLQHSVGLHINEVKSNKSITSNNRFPDLFIQEGIETEFIEKGVPKLDVDDPTSIKKLTKLKHFSLISICYTIFYEKQIIPLLHRMTNLEELTLLLSILSIVSQTVNKNIKIDLPSNDNIQSSFIERGYNQVGSYADFNSTTNVGRCHVFSLPYRFEIFINLNNFFTGGIFNKVRCLFMNDTSSFEHELFALVSQAFPYLEKLYVYNFQAQKNKQHSSTLIVFSHLVKLILRAVHVDYAEQFLFEKNTRLPRLLELTIEYETLAIVTNNFTNDAARLNCVNLQNIHIEGSFVRPESFHHYFPLLIGGCTFDRPLLGEFYSYENGLETHTSLKENGVVDRRSYRRESGAGATRKDGGDLLVTQDLGHCYQLTVRQNYYELIYRDEDKSCFQCYQMFNRTKNVIQIRKSSCGETTSLSTNQMNFDDLCRTIDEQSEFITLFSKSYSAEVC